MRLMGDGQGELPLDKYAKYKTAPQLWYDEMSRCGLNNDEVQVLEKYLKVKSGIADTQEVMMQLVIEPKIANFNMAEANKLRKCVAKKIFSEVINVQKLYYDKGLAAGNRKELLDYVWKHCIALQLGYSFSSIHTTGYSVIAVQEMNLAYYYPIIYWNCACLSVDSSAINSNDFYNLIDNNIINIDDDDEDEGGAKNKMDYAKLAAALDKFKKICAIKTPDINESRLSFTPDVKTNTILYGLKGINKITDPAINEIMINRPYKSLQDFLEKVPSRILTRDKIINLIKCGAFDAVEQGKSRADILREYLLPISEPKKRLTMQNALGLINHDLLPQSLEYNIDCYMLTKELRKHRDTDKNWYNIDTLEMPVNKVSVWQQIFKDSKIQPQYITLDGVEGNWIDSRTWDNFYKAQMDIVKIYIQEHQQELLDKLNNELFMELWNKYCLGDNLQWELDSLNFYFSGHPLKTINKDLDLDLAPLNSIVEGAVVGSFHIDGKMIPKMKLYTIAGTVIDRDKVKGMVTIQTPDGVINLKVYKDLYSTMIAATEEQDSFFEKGIHLLVTGILRGTTFIPKVYKSTGRKSILRIILDKNNNFVRFETKGDPLNGNTTQTEGTNQ